MDSTLKLNADLIVLLIDDDDKHHHTSSERDNRKPAPASSASPGCVDLTTEDNHQTVSFSTAFAIASTCSGDLDYALLAELLDKEDHDRKPAAAVSRSQFTADHALALKLQTEEQDRKPAAASSHRHQRDFRSEDPFFPAAASTASVGVDTDHALAVQLQKKEQELYHNEKADEEDQMHQSFPGKAWKFVENILELHSKNDAAKDPKQQQQNILSPVATDDMVYTAERMLLAQEEFRKAGKPVLVDIGYHYTNSVNLTRIKTDGLMSKQEREANSITASKYNGSTYGEGIYAAANASAFNNGRYGDIGLLVARLRGVESVHPAGTLYEAGNDSIGVRRKTVQEFTVLQTSRQCLPLFQFAANSIVQFSSRSPGNLAVHDYHVQLQKVVDDFFNRGVQTFVPSSRNLGAATTMPVIVPVLGSTLPVLQYPALTRPVAIAAARRTVSAAASLPSSATTAAVLAASSPSGGHRARQSGTSAIGGRQRFYAPGGTSDTLHYVAPPTFASSPDSTFSHVRRGSHSTLSVECVICLDPLMRCDLQGKIVRLIACGHYYHKNCIEQALEYSSNCPTCRKAVGTPQGKMPSGRMSITRSPSVSCEGYAPAGSIIIHYSIPREKQNPYHINPGEWHDSAKRTAYLPDTVQGNNLLKRLKFAFNHGLTFTVGISMTSGRANSVTWASIHHKTSVSGGLRSHGFPDPNFFQFCNMELDSLSVPSAVDL